MAELSTRLELEPAGDVADAIADTAAWAERRKEPGRAAAAKEVEADRRAAVEAVAQWLEFRWRYGEAEGIVRVLRRELLSEGEHDG